MTAEKYHFIGIGGIGMSGLARILLQKGSEVSGSDSSSSTIIESLQKQGAEIYIGHAAQNIQNPSAVIYSTVIKEENPEVKEARDRKIPFLHRSELLHRLMQDYSALLVTGTHGKTTTSSLLTHLFVEAQLDPTYAVGGLISSLGTNAGYGRGSYFIAEADESDGSFLAYAPFGAIITNIDNDHLDYWKTLEKMIQGFQTFLDKVISQEHLFWCGDDEILRSMKPPGFSYGFDERNDLHIKSFRQEGWKNIFDLCFEGVDYCDIVLPLIGGHNVLNASAVFGMGIKVGISEEEIRKAFLHFKGVSRRAELKWERSGITIFDDYGHHPTEIFATLRAIKHAIADRRLVVAFQPHRYTRTRDCLHEFGPAFEKADLLILTDIYASSESPIDGITSEALLATIRKNSSVNVLYSPRDQLCPFLKKTLQPQDVLVTMGAGDITFVGPEVGKLLT